MILFNSERFSHHLTPPGHPERPERAEVLRRVAERWAARGHELREPPAVATAALLRVHDADYVRSIRDTARPRRDTRGRWLLLFTLQPNEDDTDNQYRDQD